MFVGGGGQQVLGGLTQTLQSSFSKDAQRDTVSHGGWGTIECTSVSLPVGEGEEPVKGRGPELNHLVGSALARLY